MTAHPGVAAAALALGVAVGLAVHHALRPRLRRDGAARPSPPWLGALRRAAGRLIASDALLPEQFERSLVAVAQATRAGLGVLPALRAAGEEATAPLRERWQAALRRYDAGAGLAEAFTAGDREADARLWQSFAAVLAAHQEAGGPLSPALLALADSLRQRRALRGELAAHAAEARLTAWALGLAVPALAAGMATFAPELLAPLWSHPVGRLAAAASTLWWAAGALLARRVAGSPARGP